MNAFDLYGAIGVANAGIFRKTFQVDKLWVGFRRERWH
jgi:hypothetical protein